MKENSLKITIQNLKGLHARATASFVKEAEKFQSDITITNKEGVTVSGKSIMGILMLGVPLGDEIEIKAVGPDSDEAIESLKNLINNRFGED
ncbi:MAG: HPr family phosphocarrier protein [Alphaproteobacteria bacterium]|nr:HPr family phosphocarrier protein [Alphaproteobacteria bacterium]